jgi:hypothetical protein
LTRAFAARVLSGALLALAPGGCAERTLPPPAPVLSVDRPGAAIPGDLDVAIRLDLAVARRLFGPEFGRAIALDITDRATDAATGDLIAAALARADAAWIAFRPGLSAHSTDNVLLFRGEFSGLEPRAPGTDWRPAVDLGGAMRVYERHAPQRRSAPARIYARADDWLVFVSTAEIDATERSIERHAGDEHVDPPDHGLISIAARVRPLVQLLAKNYPAVAEALVDASTLEGNATADDRGLAVDLSARFSNDADATRARDRARLFLSVLGHAKGPFAALARGAACNVVGTNLVVRIGLDARGLAEVMGMMGGNEGTGTGTGTGTGER